MLADLKEIVDANTQGERNELIKETMKNKLSIQKKVLLSQACMVIVCQV